MAGDQAAVGLTGDAAATGYEKGRRRPSMGLWRDGAELCARLVFRASRNELRRAGITTPAALYDELKQIFWNADEGVTLGDHLSVGFGKVDRRRQVRAFARSRGCRSPAPGILAGQNIVVNGHLLA